MFHLHLLTTTETRQIANYLSDNNKTRAGKNFGKRTVDNILVNEKYTGSTTQVALQASIRKEHI